MDARVLLNLRKFLAPEIVYGIGALSLAGRHGVNLGGTKALIVTDQEVRKCGWTGKVETSLKEANLPFVVFDSVTPNPKDYEVKEGADLYIKENCDIIFAVGGGSPMDCAKGIGVVATNGGKITDYEGVNEVAHPAPPFIFIPTTAGTSADISQFAIITDTSRQVKIAIISKMVIPDIALVDPETTVTMPQSLTAATGMDALCHAFEAFVSTASSPLTDMTALNACELIFQNLQDACKHPKDLKYRENMMMASLMAGLAFSNASLGLVHAMAHCLGGSFDLAHGDCNALLLEKVVEYNYQYAPEKYNRLAKQLQIGEDKIQENDLINYLPSKIAALREAIGIDFRLKDMGISLDDISELANYAQNDPCVATNPRQTNVSEIAEIYRSIF